MAEKSHTMRLLRQPQRLLSCDIDRHIPAGFPPAAREARSHGDLRSWGAYKRKKRHDQLTSADSLLLASNCGAQQVDRGQETDKSATTKSSSSLIIATSNQFQITDMKLLLTILTVFSVTIRPGKTRVSTFSIYLTFIARVPTSKWEWGTWMFSLEMVIPSKVYMIWQKNVFRARRMKNYMPFSKVATLMVRLFFVPFSLLPLRAFYKAWI